MKYKLKKWYPSLPKDWEVGMEVESYTIDKRYYVSNQRHKPLISQTEVENNPEFWEKVEDKPILITEDGVEIFKGDIYWRLIAVIKKYRTFIFLEKSDEKGIFPYRGGGGKFFSTKEAAEKYLDENKPMYSKKDMLSFGASMSSNLYPYQCEGRLEYWKRFKKEKGE